VRVLASNQGTAEAIEHFANMSVDASRLMVDRVPDEPDYRRALARSLIHRAQSHIERFGRANADDLSEALAIVESMATADLPWRLQEARETHDKVKELLPRCAAEEQSLPCLEIPVFARWLDRAAAAAEVPLLLSSKLLRYVARVSERVQLGRDRLHLVDGEVIHLHHADGAPDWFSVGCLETRRSGTPDLMGQSNVVTRAPLVLLGGEWRITSCERLKMDSITAVRTCVQAVGRAPASRMYVLIAENSSFRWTVTLGFRTSGDDWDRLAADDATAAVTFSRLELG
jgi:hypothetical protein